MALSMPINLRDYQREAVDEVLKDYYSGNNRLLIHLPTAAGKTIVMAALAREFNKRVLVLAHREELIAQAADKFLLYWPEADLGICMAGRKEVENTIVIGSVQSCFQPKRLKSLQNQGFELLLIDEAHHAASASYQKIIETLGFTPGSGNLLVGVTATPMRTDKKALGQTFDKLTYSRSISTMVKSGYLAPVVGRKILTSFALDKLKTRAGDFCLGDLSAAVNTPERNSFIAAKYKEHASDRKGVAFCADVQHCKDLADALRAQGVPAAAVWGDMEQHERRQALESLKDGGLQVLTSCGILTEGFDEPSISCIAMARPTKSKGLYIQCVGRGLRLYPGKSNCLVLDFTDASHDLDNVASLATVIPEAFHISQPAPAEGERDSTRKIADLLVECDAEFDILGGTRFVWIPVGDEEWSLLDDERNEIVISQSGAGYVARIYWSEGQSQPIITTPLPLDYCSGLCEDFARRHLKVAFADPTAPWMNRAAQPTEAQRRFLEKHGKLDPGLTKYSAAIEIKRVIAVRNKAKRAMASEPPTPKQQYALLGYGVDSSGMSKLAAMLKISQLKSAGACP
jgi:ATP-dependent helicase IRC3